MAITWDKPPGSKLASAYEAIGFSVTSDIAFVSVWIGDDRVEELAYRDGAFCHPYLGSTKVGGAVSLRRSGGWPPGLPTVAVEERQAGSAGWRVLYSADFAGQPALQPTAPGKYTILGLDWYVQASSNPQAAQAKLTPGSGLRIDGGQSYEFTSGALPRWVLPLAGVPGFRPGAPLMVWADVDANALQSAGAPHTAAAIIGLCEATASGAHLTTAQRNTRHGFGLYYDSASAATNPYTLHAWKGDIASVGGGFTLEANGTTSPWKPPVLGMMSLGRYATLRYVAPRATPFVPPDPYDVAPKIQNGSQANYTQSSTAAGAPAYDAATRDPTKLALYLALHTGGSTIGAESAAFHCMLRGLWLMQPGLA